MKTLTLTPSVQLALDKVADAVYHGTAERQNVRRVAMIALEAFCDAMIRQDLKTLNPGDGVVACDIRKETREELWARMVCVSLEEGWTVPC